MKIKRLFNPFEYIAGSYSLIIGVLIILFTSLISFFSNTHFTDVISVKTGANYPMYYYIIQNLLNWVVISSILSFIAMFFSKSRIRIIDIFGTQALARAPYLLAALIGFSSSVDHLGKYILWHFMQLGEPIELGILAMVIAISLVVFTLLLSVWLIALMYNAFSVSANLKGFKSIILFVAGLIISIIISSLLNIQLTQIL